MASVTSRPRTVSAQAQPAKRRMAFKALQGVRRRWCVELAQLAETGDDIQVAHQLIDCPAR